MKVFKNSYLFGLIGVVGISSLGYVSLSLASCAQDSSKFRTIPLTDKYFKFGETTIGEQSQTTVLGFSDEVEENPDLLNDFNSLDFSNQTAVKYIAGNCSFAKDIMENWNLLKMDFSKMTFLNNSDGQSGLNLFVNYDLSSVEELNLEETIWASEGTIHSAASTFNGANLSNLKSLNLEKAVFAAPNMLVRQLESVTIKTGSYTFFSADLSSLIDLNLKDAVFATTEMVIADSSEQAATIDTADSMFYSANLNNLTSFDLNGVVFGASMMSTYTSTLSIACRTFAIAKLNNLTKLSLSGAIAAVDELMSATNIRTYDSTFRQAEMSKLTTLDLRGTKFATDEMSPVLAHVGYQTFKSINFNMDVFNKIYLPEYLATDKNWEETFNVSSQPTPSVTIYGYTECPSWFANNWWPEADWEENDN